MIYSLIIFIHIFLVDNMTRSFELKSRRNKSLKKSSNHDDDVKNDNNDDDDNDEEEEENNDDDDERESIFVSTPFLAIFGAILAVLVTIFINQVRILSEALLQQQQQQQHPSGRGVALIDVSSSSSSVSDVSHIIHSFVERNEPFVCRNCLMSSSSSSSSTGSNAQKNKYKSSSSKSLLDWWNDDVNLLKAIGPDTPIKVRVAQRTTTTTTTTTHGQDDNNNNNKNDSDDYYSSMTHFQRRSTIPTTSSSSSSTSSMDNDSQVGGGGGGSSAYPEQTMTAQTFFEGYNDLSTKEHWYAAQNNIESDLIGLLPFVHDLMPNFVMDVGPTPPQEQRPITIYIGAGKRSTQIHYDSLENVVCLVRGGTKRFELYDPFTSSSLLYVDRSKYDNASPVVVNNNNNENDHDTNNNVQQQSSNYPLFRFALPVTVELQVGDCLYLPVYWYHKVISSQESTISINWWRLPNRQKMMVLENIFCNKYDYGSKAKCQKPQKKTRTGD